MESNLIEKERKNIKDLYLFICEHENIKPIPLLFKCVGLGGACCNFEVNRMTGKKIPLSIEIDTNRISCGAAHAVIHEVTHQMLINDINDHGHGAKFKKREKMLQEKYLGCLIARKIIW